MQRSKKKLATPYVINLPTATKKKTQEVGVTSHLRKTRRFPLSHAGLIVCINGHDAEFVSAGGLTSGLASGLRHGECNARRRKSLDLAKQREEEEYIVVVDRFSVCLALLSPVRWTIPLWADQALPTETTSMVLLLLDS